MRSFAAFAVATLLAVSAHAQSIQIDANPDAPLIRVSGEGLVEIEPDRVTLGLGVTADGKTAVEAQNNASGAMNRVLTALRAMSVPGQGAAMVIQTSQISVSPRYADRRNRDAPPEIVGYQASQRVTVRLDDVSKAGEALDNATRAGANQNYGVTFGLQDRAQPESEALAAAVKEARARAEAIATAAGGSLGPIVMMGEPASSSGGFARGQFMASRASADIAPPVEGGKLTITERVEITFAFSPN